MDGTPLPPIHSLQQQHRPKNVFLRIIFYPTSPHISSAAATLHYALTRVGVVRLPLHLWAHITSNHRTARACDTDLQCRESCLGRRKQQDPSCARARCGGVIGHASWVSGNERARSSNRFGSVWLVCALAQIFFYEDFRLG
ncbi:hypothetical protein BC834DRAFT_883126 [Gloeopeniophorella convolvens]|nr:hypothetical protein BC834DRAFT_883126 [Gloeopeniophorella convolvens]